MLATGPGGATTSRKVHRDGIVDRRRGKPAGKHRVDARVPKMPWDGGGTGGKKPAARPATGGGRTAHIVRTEAGARRYGVAIGQPFTEGLVLHRGAHEDPRVQKAQELLVRLGLLKPRKDGSVHGNFGMKTRNALLKFQRRNGLPPTGRLDKTTMDRLTKETPGGDPPGGQLPGVADGGGRRRSSSSTSPSSGGRRPAPAKVSPAKAQTWFASLPAATQTRVMRRAREIAAARRLGF